jgi:hypothetical protein
MSHLTAKSYMYKHKIDKLKRMRRNAEDMMIEYIEAIEHQLNASDRQHDSFNEFIAKSEKYEVDLRKKIDSAEGISRKRLMNLLNKLISERRTVASMVSKTDHNIRISMMQFKQRMKKYMQVVDDLHARDIADSLDYINNTPVESSGSSLLGMLGQGLFAWKMSNAFDDLAKLSGRKK